MIARFFLLHLFFSISFNLLGQSTWNKLEKADLRQLLGIVKSDVQSWTFEEYYYNGFPCTSCGKSKIQFPEGDRCIAIYTYKGISFRGEIKSGYFKLDSLEKKLTIQFNWYSLERMGIKESAILLTFEMNKDFFSNIAYVTFSTDNIDMNLRLVINKKGSDIIRDFILASKSVQQYRDEANNKKDKIYFYESVPKMLFGGISTIDEENEHCIEWKESDSTNEAFFTFTDTIIEYSNKKLILYYSYEKDNDGFWIEDKFSCPYVSIAEFSKINNGDWKINYFSKHIDRFNNVDEGPAQYEILNLWNDKKCIVITSSISGTGFYDETYSFYIDGKEALIVETQQGEDIEGNHTYCDINFKVDQKKKKLFVIKNITIQKNKRK